MNLKIYGEQVEQELRGNILPFHLEAGIDYARGGFYGRIDDDRSIDADAPKGLVQHSRLLWTFAHAYRAYSDPVYLQSASRACRYLLDNFWDPDYQGMVWLVNASGKPIDSHKIIYGQAFAIYGLSEYFLATGERQSLDVAIALFEKLEQDAVDRQFEGYFDAFEKDWRFTDAINIDDTAEPTVKSMNTHLHMLEAYTNLLRAWDSAVLRGRLRVLIDLMLERIIDRQAGQMKMHFNAEWRSLTNHVSYGHDIEASWLLVEAAELLGDKKLLAEVVRTALNMAQVTYDEGLNDDGSLPDDDQSGDRTWWVQAEAVVGFLNAYQLSGEKHFLEASYGCWQYIQDRLIDRRYGEWIWGVDGEGRPMARDKAGLWKAPYHNGRACMEVRQRLHAARPDW
ncbi:MAG: AGE family epimerase/isomerase [Candidatus Promineifilaceae bacterium]|jgi:mannobiose 2-epimerase